MILARSALPILLVALSCLLASAGGGWAQTRPPPPAQAAPSQAAPPQGTPPQTAQQPPAASGQRIAAVVNDDVITTQDLLDRLDLAVVTSGLPHDAATRQRLAPQVLRGYIDEKLQLQEAKRLGMEASENDIDQALDTIAARNKTDRANLLRYLQANHINPATLREQLRAQIAWIKVIGREVRPKVTVSQEQIDFTLQRAASDDVELQLSEIQLPVYDRAQETAVLTQARELTGGLRNGGNFSALATQVSSAASAARGGDLGWVKLSALPADLRGPVGALLPGQISDPILTANAVQILQVRDRRKVQPAPVDRDQVRLSLEQAQLERQAARYLRDLRRDAFIDIRL